MAPDERPIPRFIAEPPQEALAYGRWAETLTPEEAAAYEDRAVQELGPECARWLATGEGL